MRDRFGMGWRPELAYGILSNLNAIDVVEVMADDLFHASRRHISSIQTLATQVPVVLHGVSLGLASATPVAWSRLDSMARVVNAIQPEFWSEHLAFVRANTLEIGHLAAPSRTDATIESTLKNLEKSHAIVGTKPLLENIATLMNPPGSTYDEPTWISHIAHESNCDLLLDLNNLYTNSVNFGYDPIRFLEQIPFERVRAIHLAGGRWISSNKGERRLLDDHRHDVPNAVYALLTEVGARATCALTVILERDGSYPVFSELLTQLGYAREALAKGRDQAIKTKQNRPKPLRASTTQDALQRASQLEHYVTQLYVDKDIRERFLAHPQVEAKGAGFDEYESSLFAAVDTVGLELAARSFERKRMRQSNALQPHRSLRTRITNWLSR